MEPFAEDRVKDTTAPLSAYVGGPMHEQTRARYPEEKGFVEREGVRVFYEIYG